MIKRICNEKHLNPTAKGPSITSALGEYLWLHSMLLSLQKSVFYRSFRGEQGSSFAHMHMALLLDSYSIGSKLEKTQREKCK